MSFSDQTPKPFVGVKYYKKSEGLVEKMQGEFQIMLTGESTE